MLYLNFVCKSYNDLNFHLGYDPKSTQRTDNKVQDVSRIDMYFLCKVLGVGFGSGDGFSTLYLSRL